MLTAVAGHYVYQYLIRALRPPLQKVDLLDLLEPHFSGRLIRIYGFIRKNHTHGLYSQKQST